MSHTFAPFHRGGSGSPLVCLHGFMDTWRTWELVLPFLERRHEVFAPTLPGHAGGPPLPRRVSTAAVTDTVERMMDDAGFEMACIVGNSLGGYLALLLAERGRADTVVALAPAGGWARDDQSYRDTLGRQLVMHDLAKAAAPHATATIMVVISVRSAIAPEDSPLPVTTARRRRQPSLVLRCHWQRLAEDMDRRLQWHEFGPGSLTQTSWRRSRFLWLSEAAPTRALPCKTTP